MKYSLDKYQFVNHEIVKNGQKIHEVIAISSYAGKTVKGIARTDPGDTFDLEKGKKLAAARCAEKIATKRLRRAGAKYLESTEILKEAQAYYQDMFGYYTDSVDELENAQAEVNALLQEL